jgi:hypothetical protein
LAWTGSPSSSSPQPPAMSIKRPDADIPQDPGSGIKGA